MTYVLQQSLWVPLQLGDHCLYYDPQSGQLWREISDAGPDVDTDVSMQDDAPANHDTNVTGATEDGLEDDQMISDDSDIAMAAHIATGVSDTPSEEYFAEHNLNHCFVPNRHTALSYGQRSRSGRPSRPLQRDNTPTPPYRRQGDTSDSDVESQTRISGRDKGKRREKGSHLRPDGRETFDVGDPPSGSAVPLYRNEETGGEVGPSTEFMPCSMY